MPTGPKSRAKGVYGKPWSQLVRKDFVPDRKTLQRLGRAMVKAVVEEAKKDFTKRDTPGRGVAEDIPNSPNFFDSFGYRIVGESTIEITSTWPWIQQITEGRDPYPMTWLTREAGRYIVPLTMRDGSVIFRVAPLTTADAWIHPGFAKHTFIQRGIKKGREKVAEIITQEMVKALFKGRIS